MFTPQVLPQYLPHQIPRLRWNNQLSAVSMFPSIGHWATWSYNCHFTLSRGMPINYSPWFDLFCVLLQQKPVRVRRSRTCVWMFASWQSCSRKAEQENVNGHFIFNQTHREAVFDRYNEAIAGRGCRYRLLVHLRIGRLQPALKIHAQFILSFMLNSSYWSDREALHGGIMERETASYSWCRGRSPT